MKWDKTRHLILLVAVMLVAVLEACEVPPPHKRTESQCLCDQLPATSIYSLMQQEVTQARLIDWATSIQGVPENSIQIEQYDGDIEIFTWERDSRYYALQTEGAILNWASIRDGRNMVTPVSCVVTCLGPPAQYRAYYSATVPGRLQELEIVYPEHGIVAGGAKFYDLSERSPDAIKCQFPMDDFVLVVPDTTESVLRRVYSSRADVDQLLEQFKPWPESCDDLELGIDPVLQ